MPGKMIIHFDGMKVMLCFDDRKIIIHFNNMFHNDNNLLHNPLDYAFALLHIYSMSNYSNVRLAPISIILKPYFHGLVLNKHVKVLKSNVYKPDTDLYC